MLTFLVVCLAAFVPMAEPTGHALSQPVSSGDPNSRLTSDMTRDDSFDMFTAGDEDRYGIMKQFSYAVLLVIVLGAGAFYLSRKLMPRLSMSRGRNLSVIETIALGPNRMLHLVEVGRGQKLLVGSTSQSISFLSDVTASLSDVRDAGLEDG